MNCNSRSAVYPLVEFDESTNYYDWLSGQYGHNNIIISFRYLQSEFILPALVDRLPQADHHHALAMHRPRSAYLSSNHYTIGILELV